MKPGSGIRQTGKTIYQTQILMKRGHFECSAPVFFDKGQILHAAFHGCSVITGWIATSINIDHKDRENKIKTIKSK
jgi:hypothetical protein